MKQKIYLETSVVSYLVAKPSKNLVVAAHQASTTDMWIRIEDFDVYISDMVIQEASKGDEIQANRRLQIIQEFPVLRIDDQVKELAKVLVAGKAIPEKCPKDALQYYRCGGQRDGCNRNLELQAYEQSNYSSKDKTDS